MFAVSSAPAETLKTAPQYGKFGIDQIGSDFVFVVKGNQVEQFCAVSYCYLRILAAGVRKRSTAWKMRKNYGTLSETITGLKNEGYTIDFNIQNDCLVCHQPNVALSPDEFEIDEVYRFEGATNPDDQSILYAISSKSAGVKGILVNGYGISSDGATDLLISKLNTHPR